MKSPQMTIGFINRFYPPYQSSTGYYAHFLAGHIEETLDAKIHVFCQKGDYHTIRPPDFKEERIVGTHHYSGKSGSVRTIWGRLLSSFWISFVLIAKAKMKGLDFYIVMTDPPFNNFWAAILLKRHSYALWTMDLYPDAFVAHGLITETNIFYRMYRSILMRYEPAFVISLGPNQSNHLKQLYKNVDYINLPIGFKQDLNEGENTPPEWFSENKLTFAYIGNVGEAHNEEFILAVANNLKENHQLIFSGYGAKAPMLKEVLVHLKGVIIMDFLQESHMPFIEVQLVTLKDEWTHICVPSKALSALQNGSAIWFNGSEASDTWQYIKEAGWIIKNNSIEDQKINVHIEGLTKDSVNIKEKATNKYSILKKQEIEACTEISNKIKKVKIKYEQE